MAATKMKAIPAPDLDQDWLPAASVGDEERARLIEEMHKAKQDDTDEENRLNNEARLADAKLAAESYVLALAAKDKAYAERDHFQRYRKGNLANNLSVKLARIMPEPIKEATKAIARERDDTYLLVQKCYATQRQDGEPFGFSVPVFADPRLADEAVAKRLALISRERGDRRQGLIERVEELGQAIRELEQLVTVFVWRPAFDALIQRVRPTYYQEPGR